jgi:Xaa-Pro aminopeptidase
MQYATADKMAVYVSEYPNKTTDCEGLPIIPDNAFSDKRQYLLMMDRINDNNVPGGSMSGNSSLVGYWRLDFYDAANKKYLDIKRNHTYTFTINKILSGPYIHFGGGAPLSEGFQNLSLFGGDISVWHLPGSNIEYQVTVEDDWANNISSNGQYSLSVSADTINDVETRCIASLHANFNVPFILYYLRLVLSLRRKNIIECNMINEKLIKDLFFRQKRVQKAVCDAGADGLLLTSDVNLFYMTGLVFNGYYYLPADDDPILFVKRPGVPAGERIFSIRKPEQIPAIFADNGWPMPENVLLETDVVSYNECMRLQNVFRFKKIDNATTLMRRIRMIKTKREIEQLRQSADRHASTYSRIPECYRPGMTDIRFQAEIEYRMRLHGSIGVFRAFGPNMNIFMGSVLTGDNAAMPSPHDYALGGGGQTALCPIGANGTLLRNGMAVMVDMAGNYTDYLTDMTRVYSIGTLPEPAYRAHRISQEIQDAVEVAAKPGVACADLYNLAYAIVKKAGLTDCFMGTRQQAKFVGHGIGLEINEPPVLTPRSDEMLEADMTFALEPKFVIPQVGAVGIENSFLVTDTGIDKLTVFKEDIIPLD